MKQKNEVTQNPVELICSLAQTDNAGVIWFFIVDWWDLCNMIENTT